MFLCGFISRSTRRLNWHWFWFESVSEDGATALGLIWEKLGIEPATPGSQGIALIHYNTAASRHRLPETKFAF